MSTIKPFALLRQSTLRNSTGAGELDLSLGASAVDMYNQNISNLSPLLDVPKRAKLSISPIPNENDVPYSIPELPPNPYTFSTQAEVKVATVAWLQSKFDRSVHVPDPGATEYFLTGSWGEPYENQLGLWKLLVAPVGDAEDPQESGAPIAAVPDMQKVCGSKIVGMVTGITAVNRDTFAISTSTGEIHLFQPDIENQDFSQILSKKLHKLKNGKPCPATHLTSTPDNSILSIGEDGGIYEIKLEDGVVSDGLAFADAISLTRIEFLHTKSLFATGNACGQVKIWDVRALESTEASSSSKQIRHVPTITLNHFGELADVSSIGPHPGRPHLLLVGYSSGSIDLWDTRNPGEPIVNIEKQDGPIHALAFHPINAENFYTGGGNGELRHWFPGNTALENDIGNPEKQGILDIDFIRDGSGLAYRSLYTSPFPINSFDISWNNRIVTSGDSGMIYYAQL